MVKHSVADPAAGSRVADDEVGESEGGTKGIAFVVDGGTGFDILSLQRRPLSRLAMRVPLARILAASA